jgi:hypothetical protein
MSNSTLGYHLVFLTVYAVVYFFCFFVFCFLLLTFVFDEKNYLTVNASGLYYNM